MTGVHDLADYVEKHTTSFRKGAISKVEDIGTTRVITIDAMPPAEEASPGVDVHFFVVAFSRDIDREAFLGLLKAACDGPGEFQEVSRGRLTEGPSYIELGAWLGSQELALRLLALGQRLDLWAVVTPERMGLSGEYADEAAGAGYVLLGPTSKLRDDLELSPLS